MDLLTGVNMIEEWKDIYGYEGLYQVSNLGNVKSVKRQVIVKGFQDDIIGNKKERLLTKTKKDNGYLRVTLHKDGKEKKLLIHRLVANAFIPKVDGKEQINHIDGNKENNNVNNLEWCNNYENGYHRDFTLNKKRKIRCIEKGTIYNSFYDIKKEMNINTSNVCQCCKGKIKTSGGYRWEYVY